MKTLTNIFYFLKVFFGVATLFTYVFATVGRTPIITISAILWIVCAIIYNILK